MKNSLKRLNSKFEVARREKEAEEKLSINSSSKYLKNVLTYQSTLPRSSTNSSWAVHADLF